MIKIEQGSIDPIRLDFEEDYSSATAFSGLIYKNIRELKRWSIDDVVWDGNTAILPLAEVETLEMPSGRATLSVKFMNGSDILFCDDVDVFIVYKADKQKLGGE